MQYARLMAGVVLGAALMVGCEKKEQPAPPPAPKTETAPQSAPQAPAPAEQGVVPPAAVPTTPPTTQPAIPAAPLNLPPAPKVEDAVPTTQASAAAADARAAARRARRAATAQADAVAKDAAPKTDAVSTDAATKEAETKLTQILAYIKDNKFELADTALKQLEDLKTKLPASLQTQVDAARVALTAAKAGNLKLPQIPGLGK